MAAVDTIFEQLGSMTVLELVELKNKIEEEWGITAAAPVAVAKALADSARDTKVLAIRGGILAGKEISSEDVEELSKLPPIDVLRGQVLAAVIAPLNAILALVNAPLQNLHGLIDARIEQLGGAPESETTAQEPAVAEGAPEEKEQEEPQETEPETQEAETDGGS